MSYDPSSDVYIYADGSSDQANIDAANRTMNTVLSAVLNEGSQRRLMDYQDKIRKKWWDIETAYNSPAAQRRRLESAGLNYALMQGGSGTGATIQTGQGKATAPGSIPGNTIFGNLASQMAEIGLMQSQARRNDAEAGKLESDTGRNDFLNRLTEADIAVQNSLAGLQGNKARLVGLEADCKQLVFDSLNSVYDVFSGFDSSGNRTYTKIKGAAVDVLTKVVQYSSENMDVAAKSENFDALVQSVADQFALAGEILKKSKGEAEVSRIAGELASELKNAEIVKKWGEAFGTWTGGVADVVQVILDAFCGKKVKVVKSMADALGGSNGSGSIPSPKGGSKPNQPITDDIGGDYF